MHLIYRFYYSCAYLFGISVFLIVSLSINILSFVILLVAGSRDLSSRCRSVLQFLFRGWAWFLNFIGVLDLKTPSKTTGSAERGKIWIMNHPTILDASYMLKFITGGTCIYKKEIGSNPLYGSTAKLAGYIPNVGGADLVRRACEALEQGQDLIIFPEGTRSTHINLDNFKPGFALIAKRSKATVNVMWMESPADFMTREVKFWKVPHLTAHVTIDKIGQVDVGPDSTVSSIIEEAKQCYLNRTS